MSDSESRAARVVAEVPARSDPADRRRAALEAWLAEARGQGLEARAVEEAPADHEGRDPSMTEAGGDPEEPDPPDPWVADVEVDGERVRLELRDGGDRVVVGWLR